MICEKLLNIYWFLWRTTLKKFILIERDIMFNFILYIANAIIWTLVAVRETYKASKNLYTIAAFVWWLCVFIDIVSFVIYK